MLLLVTNTAKDPPSEGLITEEIRNVAMHGEQPTIGKLAGLGKVLAWRHQPNELQRQHISNTLLQAVARPAPEYGDLPETFKPAPKFRCLLL